ncbi:MAG: PAS domain S-box protein [Cyanobacteria bacterium SZAS-4]|nr:PAS domain S-box protein [Cyanobacteria bacterium SZAS-4]
MRRPASLTTKVLFFVLVPLLIQLGLIALLISLEKQAEDALESSMRSRAISDTIHQIQTDIVAVSRRYRSNEALENTPLDDETGKLMVKTCWQHFDDLKELTKNRPEMYESVVQAERATRSALQAYIEIKNAFARLGPGQMAEKVLIARRMRRGTTDRIINQLIAIAEEQRKISDRAPEEQAVFRKKAQTAIFALAGFDLVLGALLAVYLTKGITTRLQRVSENTANLAAGLPLHPVMTGKDEIANLDKVFHDMAVELKEAARKERAVIDNALDFICTLDSTNRIVAANPASKSLFQMEEEQLIGRHTIDLVAEEDKEKALEFFGNLRKQEQSSPFELQLTNSKGELVETAWLAHWSKEENSTFCVVHDITERRKAEKLRQEVVAMITHDLRSPLNTVINVLDFFETQTKKLDDEKSTRYIGMGHRNADRMLSLINDLLDIEKIKSGNMNFEVQDFPVADSFASCEELTSAAAQEVGVALVFSDSKAIVSADPNLIDRVLTNLVSNAIRFSPKQSTIQISCREENGFAAISVKDQGPGIPASEIGQIFDRFRQANSGGAKNKGGSGLGLTICKAIVELHGGKIWVESSEAGSIFIFTLPLGQKPA